jgi:AcrR family transcriptional regulator
MGSMTTAQDIRADARRRVRDAMLDAAHEVAVAEGWGAVRMGAVAARVGLSRQTLHAEFGTKEALGQALVLRTTERFLLGVHDALEASPGGLADAVRSAVVFTLESTARDPLLQTVLTSARSGADETLLPLLTSRSEPVLHRSSEVLSAWVRAHHPELDVDRVHDVVDSVVRLVVSHVVLPVDAPAVVARRLADLAEAGLGLREPPAAR